MVFGGCIYLLGKVGFWCSSLVVEYKIYSLHSHLIHCKQPWVHCWYMCCVLVCMSSHPNLGTRPGTNSTHTCTHACMHACMTRTCTHHFTALWICPEFPGWAGTRIDLDFTEARDSEWQWHQLGHMQICTCPRHNHASITPLSFLHAWCPSCRPTNSVKALKA